MVAIDTNIIVRFLTNDDPVQYKKAFKLVKNNEIFIADTVILETEWVLRFAYEFKPEQIASALNKLFGLPNIYINHPALLAPGLLHPLSLPPAQVQQVILVSLVCIPRSLFPRLFHCPLLG